jgi:TatD DNase family protein
MLIDTHTHLDLPEFDADREAVLRRAWEARLSAIVNIGLDAESSRAAIALAEHDARIYATVGLHPHEASKGSARVWEELRRLAQHPKVVAIGETGLDFYRNRSPHQAQRRAFAAQLALAKELGRPVVIHDRDAHAEVLETLQTWAHDHPWRNDRPLGVLHCFSGSIEMARQVIALGFFIGIDGPVTFPNARRLVEIVRALPLEVLVIETDCPYLAPHPHRGQRNEPAYIALIAKRLAEIKGLSAEVVAETTTTNVRRLFGLG